jgi:hypothetical protein
MSARTRFVRLDGILTGLSEGNVKAGIHNISDAYAACRRGVFSQSISVKRQKQIVVVQMRRTISVQRPLFERGIESMTARNE